MADSELISLEVVSSAIVAPLERVSDHLEEIQREVSRLNRETAKSTATQKVAITTGNKWADSMLIMKARAIGVGWALKAIKIPAFIAALQTGVPMITAWIGGLGALIGNLGRVSGLMGSIPVGILGAATAFGVIKMAVSGVGDALKVMNKQGATAEEVSKALSGLSPAARKFVMEARGFTKAFQPLKDVAQSSVLPAFGAALRRITALVPTLRGMFGQMGGVISQVVTDIANLVTGKGFAGDLAQIGTFASESFRSLGGALVHVLSLFRHIAKAAGPMTMQMSELVKNWFALMDDKAANNGERMTAFFNRALDATRQWMRILSNLGATFFNFFKAGGKQGQSLADSLERITAYWREWTGSETGQQKMMRWFDEIRPILRETGYLIRDLWRGLARIDKAGRSSVVPFIRAIRVDLLPAFLDMVVGLKGTLLPSLVRMGESIIKILNFSSFQPLIDGLAMIAWALDKIITAFDAPVFHQLATGLITIGLAMKTAQFTAKMSGLTALIGLWSGPKGAKAGGAIWRFAQGYKAMKAAEAGTKVGAVAKGITGGAGIAGRIGAIGGKMGAGGGVAALFPFLAGPQAIPILIGAAVVAFVAGLVAMYVKVKWFREGVNAVFSALFNFFKNNWQHVGALLLAPFTLGLSLVADLLWSHREKITGFLGDVVHWFSMWPETIGRALSGFGDMLYRNIVQPIKDAWHRVQGLSRIPGTNFQLLGGGDTVASHSKGRGNIGRTLGLHAAIDASTPGTRRITNIFAAMRGGPDHPAGRALDLQGSGLVGYQAKVRAGGGYAEFHGEGAGRHLHSVPAGDTMLSKAGRGIGGGGGMQVTVDGPLVGYIVDNTGGVDVRRELKAALRELARESEERR